MLRHFREIKFRFFDKTNMRYQQPGECWHIANIDKDPVLEIDGMVTKDFMQFTGQRNKDKVEIFEGDILQLGDNKEFPATKGKIGVVRWQEDWGTFIIEWQWSKDQHMLDLDCDTAFDAKILGNVFQNSDIELSTGTLWR